MTDSAPPPEPISLAEAKLNLRVTSASEDALISGLIIAARQHVEGYTGLALVPNQITETVDRLGRSIDLAAWPIKSVDAIRYQGSAGALVPLPLGYRESFMSRPGRILPGLSGWGVPYPEDYPCRPSSSSTLPIEVDLTVGYDSPDDVPQVIKQAMHLLIAHFYANRAAAEVGARAAAVTLPYGVEILLAPYRMEMA